jgi:hypothetical protein
MLLSILLSFLLARKSTGKFHLLLMTILLILVSFFSLGLPSFVSSYQRYDLKYPLPLSFPFYASLYHTRGFELILNHAIRYSLGFLGFEIVGSWLPFTLWELLPFYSLFLLANITGAIIGYWRGKSTVLENSSRQRLSLKQTIKNQLNACRVNHDKKGEFCGGHLHSRSFTNVKVPKTRHTTPRALLL